LFLVLTAFGAGLVSFFSPCIIPIVPGFLAFLTGGTSGADGGKLNWQAFSKTLSFVAGFALVFILMGLSVSAIGGFLIKYQSTINIIGGAFIILLGLQILGVINLSFLLKGGMGMPRYTSGFVLGMVFSVAWTPCVGPILATILIIAGTQGSAGEGALLLSFYSLGLAVPFLLAALFWGKLMVHIKNIARVSWYLNKAAGVVLIVLGILIMTGRFTYLSAILS